MRGVLVTERLAVAAVLAAASIAAAADPELRGTSGPVAWEVVDIRQTVVAAEEIRWDYTLVLTETTGVGIQFETSDVGSQGPHVRGTARQQPFERRLAGNATLRLARFWRIARTGPGRSKSFDRPLPGGAYGTDLFYRFSGKDDNGAPVIVDIRFHLDPSVGR